MCLTVYDKSLICQDQIQGSVDLADRRGPRSISLPIDVEILLPTTGERAFIQIKSRASMADLNEYQAHHQRARRNQTNGSASSRLIERSDGTDNPKF